MKEVAKKEELSAEIVSNLIINGDLSKLDPKQKVDYYNAFCKRLGVDPVTQPFKLLKLNGKEILYCGREGTQQLNKIHSVSHKITAREFVKGCYLVTAQALTGDRSTESIGVVSIIYPDKVKEYGGGWKDHPKKGQEMTGDDLCNAIMKAETKAKRRSSLDLLGLGMLDESEIESIPAAQTVDIDQAETKAAKKEKPAEAELKIDPKPLMDAAEELMDCKAFNEKEKKAYLSIISKTVHSIVAGSQDAQAKYTALMNRIKAEKENREAILNGENKN